MEDECDAGYIEPISDGAVETGSPARPTDDADGGYMIESAMFGSGGGMARLAAIAMDTTRKLSENEENLKKPPHLRVTKPVPTAPEAPPLVSVSHTNHQRRDRDIRFLPYVEHEDRREPDEDACLPPEARKLAEAMVAARLVTEQKEETTRPSIKKTSKRKRKAPSFGDERHDPQRKRSYKAEARQLAALRREQTAAQIGQFAERAADGARDFSPMRRLVKDDTLKAPESAPVSGDPTDVSHCTIAEWIERIGGKTAYEAKRTALEAELTAWLDDRANKEWRAVLSGDGDGFSEGHPCRAAGLADATQCRSFAELDKLGGADYVSRIESSFSRSLDICSEFSGRVHAKALSDLIISDLRNVTPTFKDSTLYTFLRHHRWGHWRAETGLVENPETAPPVQHYAHCTVRDICEVLRNSRLVERLSEPCSDTRGVLIGFTALCGDAIRRIPIDWTTWNNDALDFDRECWRGCPRWSSYFAALIARLCWLPLPNIEQLGPAGRWWIGRDTPLEGPLMRQIRVHLARVTVVRLLNARLTDPRRGLFMRSVATMFRTERGCVTALEEVRRTIYSWLVIRYMGIEQLHNLTAAWLSYLFSPECAHLDYQPLSITYRLVLSEGQNALMRSFILPSVDRSTAGRRPSVAPLERYSQHILQGLGPMMTSIGRTLAAKHDKEASAKLAEEYCRTPWRDFYDRIPSDLFNQAVWSNYRGSERSVLCQDGGPTSLSVALATYCRSYERHYATSARNYKDAIIVHAMPWRAVERSRSHEQFRRAPFEGAQLCWPPLSFLEGLFCGYAQSCRRIHLNLIHRPLPWTLYPGYTWSKSTKLKAFVGEALRRFNESYRVMLTEASPEGGKRTIKLLRQVVSSIQSDKKKDTWARHAIDYLYRFFGKETLRSLVAIQRQ